MLSLSHLLNRLTREKSFPLIEGILNVTPDSFSDGNKYLHLDQALNQAKRLIDEGVDIIDIGGESTRPGALKVDLEEELKRTIPVIGAIRKFSEIPISIDTTKAEVAHQAIEAGADIINDISALRHDPAMTQLLKSNSQVLIILMHMQGEPATMQNNPQYDNVLKEINDFFAERTHYCEMNGINHNQIMLDPGLGFGKTTRHNLTILANLNCFHTHGLPLVLGASRKNFINEISSSDPDNRIGGSLAATQACFESNIEIIRVHDVKEHAQYIRVHKAITEMVAP